MKRCKVTRQHSQVSQRPEWGKDPALPAPKPVPDLHTLTMGLTSVFSRNRPTPSRMTIEDREYNLYRSSFSSETVTCRMGDGSERRLFCKYDAIDRHSAYGDRSGLAYEALVYSRVVLPSRVSAPKFYGTYKH